MTNNLRFSLGNAKLDFWTVIFGLPAGHSCSFAHLCLSKADKITGKITDGKNTEFRCFAASSEARSTELRKKRWNNFELVRKLRTVEEIKSLIINSMIAERVDNAPKYRVHDSGDFISQNYFDAWMEVAKAYPKSLFYAYTKALTYWVNRLDSIPKNFILNASMGGRNDELIAKHKLKYVKVVYSLEEAEALGLEIDHDDSHAYSKSKKNFSLLIHSTQPAGSPASKANELLKKAKLNGYSRVNLRMVA